MPRRSLFDSALKNKTLKYYNNPARLQQESPFATLYFLGEYLRNTKSDETDESIENVHVLRELIWSAAVKMWGDTSLPKKPESRDELRKVIRDVGRNGPRHPHYLFWVLELRYLRQIYTQGVYPKTVDDFCGLFNVASAAFQATVDSATKMLGEHILQMVMPAVRLETPDMQNRKILALIERPEVNDAILQLEKGHSVALSGAGGMGKTTIGIMIREKWLPHPVFWYTFRIGNNDNLYTLLFSIAHFLQTHLSTAGAASLLWKQLQLDVGSTNSNDSDEQKIDMYEGLLRADLENISSQQPLFCFDEVNMLGGQQLASIPSEYRSITLFLENLNSQTSVLLIGQSIPVDGVEHLPLSHVTLSEAMQLFKTIEHVDENVDSMYWQKLWAYCDGNLRWIELCVAYLSNLDDKVDEESIESLIQQLPETPQAYALLQRLWLRLTHDEQDILKSFLLFRSGAPVNALLDENALNSLHDLRDRKLIQRSEDGTWYLFPLLRDVMMEEIKELEIEALKNLHIDAAKTMEVMGIYTEAAYHLWQAGQPGDAVTLWYENQQHELEHGRARSAYALFQKIPLETLPKTKLNAYRVIRGRLYRLFGEFKRIVAENSVNDDSPSEDLAAVHVDVGVAHFYLGNIHRSQEHYAIAISKLAKLVDQMNEIHARQTTVSLSQIDSDQAQYFADRAMCQAYFIQAIINSYKGDWCLSSSQLNASLEIAEKIKLLSMIALIYRCLGEVTIRRGSDDPNVTDSYLDKAESYLDTSSKIFADIGDIFNMYRVESEKMHLYHAQQKYQMMIDPGEELLSYFQNIKEQQGECILLGNMAEAYMEIDELNKAELYAKKLREFEIPLFFPQAFYVSGMVAYKREKYKDAIHVFEDGRKFAEQTGQKVYEPYFNRGLGMVYTKMDEKKLAEQYLEIAIRQFDVLGMIEEKNTTERRIASR